MLRNLGRNDDLPRLCGVGQAQQRTLAAQNPAARHGECRRKSDLPQLLRGTVAQCKCCGRIVFGPYVCVPVTRAVIGRLPRSRCLNCPAARTLHARGRPQPLGEPDLGHCVDESRIDGSPLQCPLAGVRGNLDPFPHRLNDAVADDDGAILERCAGLDDDGCARKGMHPGGILVQPDSRGGLLLRGNGTCQEERSNDQNCLARTICVHCRGALASGIPTTIARAPIFIVDATKVGAGAVQPTKPHRDY